MSADRHKKGVASWTPLLSVLVMTVAAVAGLFAALGGTKVALAVLLLGVMLTLGLLAAQAAVGRADADPQQADSDGDQGVPALVEDPDAPLGAASETPGPEVPSSASAQRRR